MATYTIYPAQTVQPVSVLNNAIEGADIVFSAVLAGILLYFLNKSFLKNFPSYVAILAGIVMVLYLGNNMIIRNLGFVLLTDGIYNLIKEYVI